MQSLAFETKDGRKGLIRPAVPGDARPVIAATRQAAEESPRTILSTPADIWSPREWRRHRLDWSESGVTLVAEVAGVVVGSLSCHRERRTPLRHGAEIGLTVARDHRGIGVGRALLRGVEEWARDKRVDRIQLTVYPHNEKAIALYKAAGYEIEGVIRGAVRFPEGDLDLVLMSKLLQRA